MVWQLRSPWTRVCIRPGASTASAPARPMRNGPFRSVVLAVHRQRTNQSAGIHWRRDYRHRLNLAAHSGLRPNSGRAERRGRLLRRHGNRNHIVLTAAKARQPRRSDDRHPLPIFIYPSWPSAIPLDARNPYGYRPGMNLARTVASRCRIHNNCRASGTRA